MEQIHATCVDMDGTGVLIRGPSGSGKSDLALRLIDRGAVLVADDRVDLRCDSGILSASAPETIAGMLEVRGLGVIRMKCRTDVQVALVVELTAPEDIERIPEPAVCDYMAVALPLVRVAPFEASAPAKLRLAVARLAGQVSSVS